MTETTFQRALSRALAGKSQVDVARRAGIAPSTISTWIGGGGAKPSQLFAVERALELPPGHLSRHLGFVPAEDADDPRVDVVAAIEQDDSITPGNKDALVLLYNLFRAQRDLSTTV